MAVPKIAVIASIWGTVVFYGAQKIVGPKIFESDAFFLLFVAPLLSLPWIPTAFKEDSESGAKPSGWTLIAVLALGGIPTVLCAFPLIIVVALLIRFFE